MATDPGSRPDVDEANRSGNVPRTVLWSYAATGASVALWIMLVVVNRRTNGGVHLGGDQADLLAFVLPLWIALGVTAFLLALIGLMRSRAKGHAILPLLLAAFVGAVPIIEYLWP